MNRLPVMGLALALVATSPHATEPERVAIPTWDVDPTSGASIEMPAFLFRPSRAALPIGAR